MGQDSDFEGTTYDDTSPVQNNGIGLHYLRHRRRNREIAQPEHAHVSRKMQSYCIISDICRR